MRLVHYYPRAIAGDGGPTLAMWEWASAARRSGCDVMVLYDAGLPGRAALVDPAIPLVPLPHGGIGRIRVPHDLGSHLKSGDVLVLHSTYMPGNLAVARTARRHGIPYIVMPHGGYNQQARDRRYHRKRLWQPVERRYLERALAVHVFFEGETRDAAQVAPNAHWIVAPTGFGLPSERWDGGSGGYLAWLGRYDVTTKGLDLLVRALGLIEPASRRPLRLHGKPSEDGPADIERIARMTGVADFVTVGGQIGGSEKVDFFRRASAYVHPSRWESHSLAIVEALAYGIPTVVSIFCSIAPKLDQAGAAVLVEPAPQSIANGISTVLRDPQHYSDRARLFVQTHLSWDVIMSDYLRQIACLRKARPAGR